MEIKDENFKKEVLDSKKLVMIDFWASWCMPCQMLKPTIEEIAKEVEGKADVRFMNIDESPNTAKEYSVMSIPTVLFFKDGDHVETLVGMHPKDTYINIINELSEK